MNTRMLTKPVLTTVLGRSVLRYQKMTLTVAKCLPQKSGSEADIESHKHLPFWKLGVPRYWMATMTQNIDVDNILPNTIEKRRVKRALQFQRFSPSVVHVLGPQKALGQVVHHLQGKIKLHNEDEWRDLTKPLHSPKNPNLYPWEVKIEAIDLSGTEFMYDGVQYLTLGRNLLHLNMSNCKDFNDYGVALLNTINSLVSLDLSHNPYVTERCLIPLKNLSNLQRLDLSGIEYFRSRPIALIAVEEHLPNCVVVYNPPDTPEPKQETQQQIEDQ